MGAHVFIACRSGRWARGPALDAIRSAGGGPAELLDLDLGDLAVGAALRREFLARDLSALRIFS